MEGKGIVIVRNYSVYIYIYILKCGMVGCGGDQYCIDSCRYDIEGLTMYMN